jgi:phage tail-like protein
MKHPMAGYHFMVEWGGERTGCTSVEGLDQEVEIIDYREGSMVTSGPMQIPGLRRSSTVVLRRGIMPGDGDFGAWLRTVNHGTAERRDLTISLLNESHEPVAVWKIREAWPCRLEGPRLNAQQSEIAFEALALAHEGIEVEFV